eukprot:4081832-Prymnesium_polylepis.2
MGLSAVSKQGRQSWMSPKCSTDIHSKNEAMRNGRGRAALGLVHSNEVKSCRTTMPIESTRG